VLTLVQRKRLWEGSSRGLPESRAAAQGNNAAISSIAFQKWGSKQSERIPGGKDVLAAGLFILGG